MTTRQEFSAAFSTQPEPLTGLGWEECLAGALAATQ